MCTGIQLKAKDGTMVYGRTMEWGTFDLRSRVGIYPRDYRFTGFTGHIQNGKRWQAKYGFVCLDALEQAIAADGMNEKGLCAGMFYHPNYAKYELFDESHQGETISSIDLVQYVLSNYATISEVKSGLKDIHIVGQFEPSIGLELQIHLAVVDATGQSIVIEFINHQMVIFDNPLGVITNAPYFDWHMENLKNYLFLQPQTRSSLEIDGVTFSPFGGGSGFLGLPGDFTPPSRFVRATAFSKTSRPTHGGFDTVQEVFRILDNFNVPLGASEGPISNNDELTSSTLWTTAWDSKNLVLYYHTEWNRQIRKLEFKDLDFAEVQQFNLPLDGKKEQLMEDVLKRE